MEIFSLNSYVDAKDSKGIWRLAKILDKKDDLIFLSFDGWSSKRNKVFIRSGIAFIMIK